ncbi:hypothetical protein HDU93_006393 [Gonapodya sp. JEL0774]|nr:hypothetical protein HDU93_006393 [Gonapodya sp. JEL0774]
MTSYPYFSAGSVGTGQTAHHSQHAPRGFPPQQTLSPIPLAAQSIHLSQPPPPAPAASAPSVSSPSQLLQLQRSKRLVWSPHPDFAIGIAVNSTSGGVGGAAVGAGAPDRYGVSSDRGAAAGLSNGFPFPGKDVPGHYSMATSPLHGWSWAPRSYFVVGVPDLKLYRYDQVGDQPHCTLIATNSDFQLTTKCFAWSPSAAIPDLLAVGQQTGRVSLVRLSSFAGLSPSKPTTAIVPSSSYSAAQAPPTKALAELQPRHARTCNAVSFCPSDPRFLAAGFDKVRNDSGLYVWDLEHGVDPIWSAPSTGAGFSSWGAPAARRFDSLSSEEELGTPPAPSSYSEITAPTASRPSSLLSGSGNSFAPPPRPSTPSSSTASPTPPKPPHSTFAPAESIHSLVWLPTLPHRLAAGAGGKHVRIYDLRSGSGSSPTASVTTRYVSGLCFDPRRPHLMASYAEGPDGGIKLWDLRRTSEPVVSVACPTEWKMGVAQIGWSGDRTGVLAGTGVNSPVVKVWDVVEAVEARRVASEEGGYVLGDNEGSDFVADGGATATSSVFGVTAKDDLALAGVTKVGVSPAGTNPLLWQIRAVRTGYGTPVTCFAFVPGPLAIRGGGGGYQGAKVSQAPTPPTFPPLPARSVEEAAHKIVVITSNPTAQQQQLQAAAAAAGAGISGSGAAAVAVHHVHSSWKGWPRTASGSRLSSIVGSGSDSEPNFSTPSNSSLRHSSALQSLFLAPTTPPVVYSMNSGDPAERIEVLEMREHLQLCWNPLGGLMWSGGRSVAVVGAGEMIREVGRWERAGNGGAINGGASTGLRVPKISARRNPAASLVDLPPGVLLHRDVYDVAFTIRARAAKGYGMDADRNVEFFAQERSETKAQWRERERGRVSEGGAPKASAGIKKSDSPWERVWKDDVSSKELRNVWEWVATAKQLVTSGKAILEGRELAFSGVADVIMDAFVGERGGLSIHIESITRQSPTQLEPYRRLALAMCGWGSPDGDSDRDRDDLERALQGMEERGEWEKAAGWSLFRGGGLARAVKSLNRSGNERLKLVGTALAAAAVGTQLPSDLVNGVLAPGGPSMADRSVKSGVYFDGLGSPSVATRPSSSVSPAKTPLQTLWKNMFAGLTKDLTDAYLRAMFSLISREGDWSGVLNEQGISLRDRIGVALRFLGNNELGGFLRTTIYQVISTGNLEGLLVTGLQPAGIELLEKYVDKTGDVQTAALLGSVVVPGRFANPRVDEWVEK